MSYRRETPFESIESGLEFISYLLEATKEAQEQVDGEIKRSEDGRLVRRKQAFQLVSYKLVTLSSHISKSRQLLRDLRAMRRLLLEERRDSNLAESNRLTS